MNTFEPVIGLEIHLQLKTKSKLFCSCRSGADSDSEPNTAICPACTGRPGTLPVLNKEAVNLAIKAGIGLNMKINNTSSFARKSYFYPDLPKGYQVTQSDSPICEHGFLNINGKKIGVLRAHIEEDAAKSVHRDGYSLVDFNRSGATLIEIVSEPDMRSPEEAYGYLTELKKIMRWYGVSDCDMEKGELRVDVNVSVRPAGQKEFGTRVEIKNLNSFKAVKDALSHEIERQSAILAACGKVKQETMAFDREKCVTSPMRSKENAVDYRYFPEPDLPELNVSDEWINEIKNSLPELPTQYKERFEKEYSLSSYDAGVLTGERELAVYFEDVVREKVSPKSAANWIATDLLGYLNAQKLEITSSPLNAKGLAEIIALTDGGKISRAQAKTLFEAACKTKEAPSILVEKLGLSQISDTGALEAWVKEAVAENAKMAEQIRGGKVSAIGALVGAVMKKSKGKANPALVNELLKKEFGL